MRTDDFVSLECAKRLKALGYGRDGFYLGAAICMIVDGESVPTIYHACKWLRNKGLAVQVYLNGVRTAYFARVWKIEMNSDVVDVEGQFDTYEQAQSAGIDVALGLLEKGGE